MGALLAVSFLGSTASLCLGLLLALAAPVLRHRILVNYRAEAEGTNVDTIIRRLLETVKEPGAE